MLIPVALLVLIALSTTPAYADDLNYTTSGCFSGSVCSGGGSTASIYDLVVSGQVDTTISFAGTSGTVYTPADDVTLGTLTFNSPNPNSQAGVYVGTFDLDLSITSVDGTTFTGGPFTALMSGEVYGDAGGATLTFNPINEVFTDTDGDSFDVTLDANPIQVSSADPSATITAEFGADPTGSYSNVPEPATILLSGVGFVGLFLMKRRLALA